MLKGKNVLITGSNRGIGFSILKECAKNGAYIWAHARKESSEFLEKIMKLSSEFNVTIKPIFFDISDKESVKRGVKEILSEKKNVDVLINNAGILYNASFMMSSEKKLYDVFNVNFFSTFILTQYIVRIMVRNNRGSIVNISSMAAIDGNLGKSVYGASKSAIITMSKVLANELGTVGIRSNCIAPGIINTDILENMPSYALQSTVEQTSLKRLGEPKEVASVAVFLASDESSYINGQVIRVDGGL